MDSKDLTQLIGLLGDAAFKLQDYLTYNDSIGPAKDLLKDELFRVLEDIQLFAINQKEE